MDEKIPRHDFAVTDISNRQIGRITSGTFSPLLKKGIGMAYIETPDSQVGAAVQVVVRGSRRRRDDRQATVLRRERSTAGSGLR